MCAISSGVFCRASTTAPDRIGLCQAWAVSLPCTVAGAAATLASPPCIALLQNASLATGAMKWQPLPFRYWTGRSADRVHTAVQASQPRLLQTLGHAPPCSTFPRCICGLHHLGWWTTLLLQQLTCSPARMTATSSQGRPQSACTDRRALAEPFSPAWQLPHFKK